MNRLDIIRAYSRMDMVVSNEEAEWVMASCPLAPYKHEKGYDSSASFGTHIEDDGISFINCFTCGAKGTLPQLARTLAMYRDDPELREYANVLERQEIIGGTVDFGKWTDAPKSAKKSEDRVTRFPNEREFFRQYPSVLTEPRAVAYLRRRGISASAVITLGLRYDPAQWRILFPVYDDRTGKFAGATGRTIRNNEFINHRKELAKRRDDKRLLHPKIRDYKGLQKDRLLLGFTPSNRQYAKRGYIVVEGLFALARVRSVRSALPVRALLGSVLTPAKAELFASLGAPLFWLTDPDAAGRKALYGKYDEERAQRYIEKAERLEYDYDPFADLANYNPQRKPEDYGALDKLYGKVAQFILPYPEGLRDVDNVTGEQLDWMLANAELYVQPLRKNLTKVGSTRTKSLLPRQRR